MSSIVTNLLLFQLAWWACVLGGAWGRPWLGPVVALLPLLVYLLSARDSAKAAVGLVLVVALGFAVDCGLSLGGVTTFPGQAAQFAPCPVWMLALWVAFATTLNGCLAWLRPLPVAAFVFGLFGGPLAYYAAEQLGALQVAGSWSAWLAIAVGWGIVLPGAYRLMPPSARASAQQPIAAEIADA